MTSGRRGVVIGLLAAWAMAAVAVDYDEDYDKKPWEEMAVSMPPAPVDERLLPIYVSEVTTNRFLIDPATLTVGADGVVRYVLVVVAGAGARNVTYEGMRCETRERRIYAAGRRDGSWSKSRNNEWKKIQDQTANRYHAALYLEYFCPGGIMVRNPEEAIRHLRAGGAPR